MLAQVCSGVDWYFNGLLGPTSQLRRHIERKGIGISARLLLAGLLAVAGTVLTVLYS